MVLQWVRTDANDAPWVSATIFTCYTLGNNVQALLILRTPCGYLSKC